MRGEAIVARLQELTDEQFARVAPFLEADLDIVDELDRLHDEIRAGRRSAATEPVLSADDVYARARRALGA